MTPDRIMTLFEELVGSVSVALGQLGDWGLSGDRDTQYNHDVVADDIFVERLLGEGFAVLSEETGLQQPASSGEAASAGTGVVTVVVDPVDGSTNASRGLPWYATSLCAIDERGASVAMVVNLATGQRFRAIRGQGIEVDTIAIDGRGVVGLAGPPPAPPSDCTELSEAIIAFSGLPPSHGGWAQYRAYGAAALDLCGVAVGTFDGYIDIDRAHGPWDYMGALLVCQEAGVEVVDSRGEELVTLDPSHRRGPIAGCTPALTAQLRDMTRAWLA